MKNAHVIRAVFGSAWAIQPEKMAAIVEFLGCRAAGMPTDYESKADRPLSMSGSIAVIPVVGVVSQRVNMLNDFSGGVSTDKLKGAIASAVNDPTVKAIVLDVDSPGGSVYGVAELADYIRSVREQKPIVAVANSLMASAAYWIGSAATELSVTPGGEVGSVGVIAAHVDWSKYNEKAGVSPTYVYAGEYKAELNPDAPLTDAAKDYLQTQVDSYYSDFVTAVAKGRNTGVENVRANYGKGRTLRAKEALSAGMVDRIETLDQAIARVNSPRFKSRLLSAQRDSLSW